MASKPHQSVADRARHDRAFLKKALANPGLRSKLPSSMLPADLRQRRETNARLAAPIVPGSSMTEGALANAAQAATAVKYGPSERELGQQLGVAQQTQQDTGSFYDQYLANLAQHQQNVAAFQAGAQQGLAQTAAGITGLSGQEGAALQQQANQAAQPGVAPAGNLAGMASDAAAVRQALIGSFQAQQALQGANANTYADTQARVVGPGQKLAAQAQAAGRTRDVRKQVQQLKDEEGAYNQSFRDQRRQDEFKNVLAAQTLGANVAQDQAQAQVASQRVTETVRHNRTQEQIAKDRNRTAAKTAQQKADLAAGKVNQYGYTDAAWRAMSTEQRQKVIKDFKATGKSKNGQAPNWQTPQQQQKFWGQVDSVVAVAKRLGATPNMTQGQRRQIAERIMADPKNPGALQVSVALDKIIGHLSPNNVQRLHDNRIQIKTGGVPTRAQAGISADEARKRRARRTPSPGSAVPGIGSTVNSP